MGEAEAHVTQETLEGAYWSDGKVVWKAGPVFPMDMDILLPVTVKWDT